jgi:serine/threonine-protein kinase
MSSEQLGNWIIDKELGRGGMGRVYLAHEAPPGDRQAAVKVLAAELAQEAGFLHRFEREIETLRQLDHPNIVKFYDSGAHQGVPFYAMEYIEGQTYEDLLLAKGRLPWKDVLDMALQVCPALKHAHDRGIIHRDLKPPNLLRTPAGLVKLTDFGIAKVFSSTHLTSEGGIVGTAEFLSPEQAAGKPVTKRSDLYSLGVVLYTLLTGRTPFEGETVVDLLHKHRFAQFDRPQERVLDIPHEIDDVVCQLLEKDPARRPADAMVLQRKLESIRRKLERTGRQTLPSARVDATQAYNLAQNPEPRDEPGPATLMSRLMRQELQRQKRGGPLTQFFNRPWVLAVLLLLCIGLILWGIFRPKSAGTATEPDDEASAGEDQVALRRALNKSKNATPMSEAQRFYLDGLRLCREGDVAAANRVWTNVVIAFEGVESEKHWVELANKGLDGLRDRVPDEERRWEAVNAQLAKARRLRADGKPDEAEAIWRALEALYENDPSARDILETIKKDRGR